MSVSERTAPVCLVSSAPPLRKTIEKVGGAAKSVQRSEKDLCFWREKTSRLLWGVLWVKNTSKKLRMKISTNRLFF